MTITRYRHRQRGFGLLDAIIWALAFMMATSLAVSLVNARRQIVERDTLVETISRQMETFMEASYLYLTGIGSPAKEELSVIDLVNVGLLSNAFPKNLPTGNRLLLRFVTNSSDNALIDMMVTIDHQHNDERLKALRLQPKGLSTLFSEAISLARKPSLKGLIFGVIPKDQTVLIHSKGQINLSAADIEKAPGYARPAMYVAGPNQKGFILLSVSNKLGKRPYSFFSAPPTMKKEGTVHLLTQCNGCENSGIYFSGFSLECPSNYTLLPEQQEYQQELKGNGSIAVCIPAFKGDYKDFGQAKKFAHVMGEAPGYSTDYAQAWEPQTGCGVGLRQICYRKTCNATSTKIDNSAKGYLLNYICHTHNLFNPSNFVDLAYPVWTKQRVREKYLGLEITLPVGFVLTNYVAGKSLAFRIKDYFYHFQSVTYRFHIGPDRVQENHPELNYVHETQATVIVSKNLQDSELITVNYQDTQKQNRQFQFRFPYDFQ